MPIRHRISIAGLARIAGLLLSVVAIIYVAMSVRQSFGALQEQLVSWVFLTKVAVLSVAYALLLQLVGLGWFQLLRPVDGGVLRLSQALQIYSATQFYKYLPGNVFHLAGRYAMARKAGSSHAALALAQVGEIGIIVLAAASVASIFSWSLLVNAARQYNLDDTRLLTGIIALGVTGAVLLLLAMARYQLAIPGRKATIAGLVAYGFYVLFFIGSGLIVLVLTNGIGEPVLLGAGDIIGISAAAWLLGYVVLGAPGGVGVREAVLVFGFTALGMSPAAATTIALGFRLITVLGDGILGVLGYLAGKAGA